MIDAALLKSATRMTQAGETMLELMFPMCATLIDSG